MNRRPKSTSGVKRALLVGIDDYVHHPLTGCVADAEAMAAVLERNEDGSLNYAVHLHTSATEPIDRPTLRTLLAELFKNAQGADLLFYFSGHGAQSPWGAELVTQDYIAAVMVEDDKVARSCGWIPYPDPQWDTARR